jgi:hypothetical protein
MSKYFFILYSGYKILLKPGKCIDEINCAKAKNIIIKVLTVGEHNGKLYLD